MDRKRNITWKARARSVGTLDFEILRKSIIGDANFVQRLKLDARLAAHTGCVNSICWSENGETILSGSDDKKLAITNAHSRVNIASITSGHRANIFCAKYIPVSSDKLVVSCSGDGMLAFNEVEREDTHGLNMFNCHYGTVYELATVPYDAHSFLSCGEDGTVRFFDLRMKTKCNKEECREDVLINCRCAVTSLSVNPVIPYHLAVGCSDSSIRIFDRRMLGTKGSGNFTGRGIHGMFSRFSPSHLETKYCRPTSLSYSHDGREMLVSYSSEYIYLFGTYPEPKVHLPTEEDWTKTDHMLDKDEMPPVNPVKRLRVRGDWSDTGPTARPRAESSEIQSPQTVMQRMSELFTRWLEDAASNQPSVLLDLPRTSLDTSFRMDETSRSREPQRENQDAGTSQQSTAGSCEVVGSSVESTPGTSRQTDSNLHQRLNQTSRSPLSDSQGSSCVKEMSLTTESCLESKASCDGSSQIEGVLSAEEGTTSSMQSIKEGDLVREDLNIKDKKRRRSQYRFTSDGAAAEELEAVSAAGCPHRSKKVLKVDGESGDSSGDDNEGKNNKEKPKREEFKEPATRKKEGEGMRDKREDQISSGQNEDEASTSRKSETQGDDNSQSSLRGEQLAGRMISRGERVRRALLAKAREEQEKEKQRFRNVTCLKVKKVYRGHRNSRTMIKEAGFWGENLVLSGSDCGHVFIWDRHTAQLIMLLEGDKHVVNCVQPHPHEPILATSGIDYDIKLWAPLAEEPCRPANADEVMRVNELMLEETRDTITVPPSFILRMISTLQNLRTSRQQPEDSSSIDEES